MSLLLDALKRAAEQKAKQAKEAESKSGLKPDDSGVSADAETELGFTEDNTELSELGKKHARVSADDEVQLGDPNRSDYSDETYLTQEQTATQSQDKHGRPDSSDETNLNTYYASDETASRIQIPDEEQRDSDDETQIIFSRSDDVIESAELPQQPVDDDSDDTYLAPNANEDDTLLSQYHGGDSHQESGEETNLNTYFTSDETLSRVEIPDEAERDSDDETQIIASRSEDVIESYEQPRQPVDDDGDETYLAPNANEDDTQISQYHDRVESLPERDSDDDTQIVASRSEDVIESYEQPRQPVDDDGDETYLAPNANEDDTQISQYHDRVESLPERDSDDDTQIVASRSEEVIDDTYLSPKSVEDEASIFDSQAVETGSSNDTSLFAGADEDDTQLLSPQADEDESRLLSENAEAEIDAGDDTNLTGGTFRDETNLHSEKESVFDTEDDTELPGLSGEDSVSQLSTDDVSDFLGKDDHLQPKSASRDQQAAEARKVSAANLFEDEPEDDTLENSVGKPESTETEGADVQMLAAEESDTTSELGLVDLTRQKEVQASSGDPTVTTGEPAEITGIDLDLLKNERTVIRPDVTSTHTYAPDNYDRTLIKPPTEDASRIFAGMRSEDDVLMTPDYAKRVFLSKSSANRAHHYKIYAGIAVSILLAIGIFSLFELQDEYNEIDLALMPLKRDPMPGVLQNNKSETPTNLFESKPDPDVDTRTLKIVQGASDATVIETETGTGSATETESAGSQQGSSASETEVAAIDSKTETEVQQTQPIAEAEEAPETVVIASENQQTVAQKTSESETPTSTSQTLQISATSKYTEKDTWLKQAYQAYQRGDDEAALKKYNQVLEIEPENRNALLARAAIAIQNGDSVSAIKDYQTLLVANPKDSLAMSSLISSTNISPQKSESQLKLMIRDEPDSPYLNFVLANIYGAQNRWQEAQSFYFKALENNPNDPNYAYNLAVSLEHIEKPKVAISYYEKALLNIDRGLATFNKDVVDRRLEVLRRL